MNERLREINHSLRTLDEAHRLGRISREDYRTRRRHLLGTLCDGGGITARNTVASETTARNAVRAVRGPDRTGDEGVAAMFPRSRWSWLLAWTRRRR